MGGGLAMFPQALRWLGWLKWYCSEGPEGRQQMHSLHLRSSLDPANILDD
jgi:hypothetical protein